MIAQLGYFARDFLLVLRRFFSVAKNVSTTGVPGRSFR